MASTTTPITPTRFALALHDLPLSTLALKVAELRNSIAHLDYSNEELKPFAEGRGSEGPDQDCIDAIRENEVVVARMLERIELLRVEVEGRGVRWGDIGGELGDVGKEPGEEVGEVMVNGDGRGRERDGERSEAWRDGTFQTGRVVGGEVRMDGVAGGGAASNGVGGASTAVTANGINGGAGAGGSLDDEALRRAMEETMRSLGQDDEDEDGGMHL